MGRKCLFVSPPDPPIGRVLRTYSGGFGDLVWRGEGTTEIRLPPIELVRMATVLRKGGWAVNILDLAVSGREEIQATFLKAPYDAIVVSLSLAAFESDIAVASRVTRFAKSKKLILRTSIAQEKLLLKAIEHTGAVMVAGIADESRLLDFLESDLPSEPRLPSVAGELVAEGLPIPDRRLLCHQPYRFTPLDRVRAPGLVTSMHTSFGCEHPCAYYCPYPTVEGRRYQGYPVHRVIEELTDAASLGISKIVMRDPVFTEDSERVMGICDAIQSSALDISWWCETRIDRTDFLMLLAMRKAGCHGIEVGVESGDPKIMRGLAKQGLTRARIEEFNCEATDAGLAPVYLFMVGLPGETRSSIKQTFDLIIDLNLRAEQFNISVVSPYPGTPLFHFAQRKGWLSDHTPEIGGYTPICAVGNLTVEDFQVAMVFGNRLAQLQRRRAPRGGNHSGAMRAFVKNVHAWVHA